MLAYNLSCSGQFHDVSSNLCRLRLEHSKPEQHLLLCSLMALKMTSQLPHAAASYQILQYPASTLLQDHSAQTWMLETRKSLVTTAWANKEEPYCLDGSWLMPLDGTSTGGSPRAERAGGDFLRFGVVVLLEKLRHRLLAGRLPHLLSRWCTCRFTSRSIFC